MAVRALGREGSGPLEEAFQQSVDSSTDHFLLDTTRSISTAETPLPRSDLNEVSIPLRDASLECRKVQQPEDAWLVAGLPGAVESFSGTPGDRVGKQEADMSISQLLITRPDEMESPAPGPATPIISRPRQSSMARSGSIPGSQVIIPTPTGPPPAWDPRSPSIDRSTSKIPRPGLGWSSPHRQAPAAQPAAVAAPLSYPDSPTQQPSTKGMQANRSLPRQFSGVSEMQAGRAQSPTPAFMRPLQRQPSGSADVKAVPAQPQKPASSRSLQRQPSGTARTRAVAAQMDSQPPSRSKPRHASKINAAPALPAQPQAATLNRGLDRQPSRTNGTQALPAEPTPVPVAAPAQVAAAPAAADAAAAVAADSQEQPQQHVAAPADDVIISPEAHDALFSPLAAPTPDQQPRLPSFSVLQHQPSDEILLESRPCPLFTGPDEGHRHDEPHQHPLLAGDSSGHPLLAGDVPRAAPAEPSEPEGIAKPTSMINQTLMSLPPQLDSWHAPDLPHDGYLPPMDANAHRASPAPVPYGYRQSETNYMMGQLAALQSETAFHQTPAVYLQQRAAFLASQAASLRTEDLTQDNEPVPDAENGPHDDQIGSGLPEHPDKSLEPALHQHPEVEVPKLNRFAGVVGDEVESGGGELSTMPTSQLAMVPENGGAKLAESLFGSDHQCEAIAQPVVPDLLKQQQLPSQSLDTSSMAAHQMLNKKDMVDDAMGKTRLTAPAEQVGTHKAADDVMGNAEKGTTVSRKGTSKSKRDKPGGKCCVIM
ncbi:hypothetical protein WJX74_001842 [Apatococcus lobatus]|uniref:Uncharacterized protein n=1 Tax=Apatococcus lobatus TaxID=904363 RepID=A0AAW1RY88_9CHLO